VGFRDEAYARIAELTGSEVTDPDDPEAPRRLYLARYAKAGVGRPGGIQPPLPGRKAKPTIAVVTLAGPIVSGRGGRQLSPFGTSSAGGDTIAAALREAAANDDVSAVVLRVDSPGGSVTASETIWREVVRLRESGTPVVASMGAVAASGGYYVSMAADAIVANAGTITGSIGVLTGKLITRDLKDKLGVNTDALRTNSNADAWSTNRPFTAEQHERMEAEADLCYTDFVARVADGRGMTVDAVDAVARGRVWTGADAQERGLVDELGGLRTAIARAKVLAGHDPEADATIVYLPGSGFFDMLRPKASSQPAVRSLSGAAEVLAMAAGHAMFDAVGRAERSLTGSSVLWLGNHRF
jgi:protease IV